MSEPAPVEVVTFGCRLNAAESEAIRRAATAAGRSDLVVVNTCAVTGEAVRQARQAIRRLRRERTGAEIVVTGCAAETETAGFAAMPEVDRILGNSEKMRVEAWRRPADQRASEPRIVLGDIMAARDVDALSFDAMADHTRAFLQAQTGCDHRCTFCVIPFGRGNSRSVRPEEAVAAARRLVENGCKEIVLTGVDVTAWGADLPGAPRLGSLVKRLLREAPDLPRLRLTSIDSVEIDADLLDAIASEDRLMPHLHLSLQSGDDLILKRMKRRHARVDAVRFCREVRRLRPDIAFGADIIAGFPTETEEMFARSLALIEECDIAYLHAFPYSPRPGTPAARMPQVDGRVIRDRAARLRAAGDAALERHLEQRVGRRLRVLAERGGVGHAEDFTSVRLPAGTQRGDVIDCVATAREGRRLLAVPRPCPAALAMASGAVYPASP